MDWYCSNLIMLRKLSINFLQVKIAQMKTPINITVHLSNNKGKRINLLKYSWIIERLMYVINYTKLDITYLITKLNGFTSNPSMDHWKVINKELRYSRYSLNYEPHYIRYLVVL